MLLAIAALILTQATTSFDVSGVHVILRQNNANNVVAANLYLLGGARQITDANAGIEEVVALITKESRFPRGLNRLLDGIEANLPLRN